MSKLPMEIHQTAPDFLEIALEIRVTCHLYCLLIFLLLSSSWMCYQVKIENKQKKRNFGFRNANTRSRFYLFLFSIFFSAWWNLTLHRFSYQPITILFSPLFKRNIPFEINSWNKTTILAIARA